MPSVSATSTHGMVHGFDQFGCRVIDERLGTHFVHHIPEADPCFEITEAERITRAAVT